MLASSSAGQVRRLVALLALPILALALVPAAHAAGRRSSGKLAVPAALRAAAAGSHRADRVLVVEARALHSCLRGSSASACAAARGAVQSAGRAYTLAQRNLARRGARAGRGGSVPRLRRSGLALSWTSSPRIAAYVLVAEVPGQADRYSVVRGTDDTPPPVPGVTVTYVVRTSQRGSRWSNQVKISYPAATTESSTPTPAPSDGEEDLDLKAAPELRASGQTLSWNAVPGVSTYVLMTHVPGQAESFTSVSGTSVTPAAVPSKTVDYSIRTAVTGSAWAPDVSIGYPAEVAEAPSGSSPGTGVSANATEGFEPGVDSGWMPLDYSGASQLGAKIVRIEWSIGTPASGLESTIAAYAARGIRVAPLAGFYGTLPSPAEAQNLANWAEAYGPGGTFWAHHSGPELPIRTIEFGNETSYGYQYGDEAGDPSYRKRAETYALRLKESALAIQAAGSHVGLLAGADDWTGNWMNGLFAAVPNFGSYIAGWVSHPYGTSARWKLESIIKLSAAHGAPSNLPIDITEWGISTDGSSCVTEDYGFNPCMNYAESAEQLKRSIAEIKGIVGNNRMGLFILYQVRDQQPAGVTHDREAYFGLLQHEDQPKGAFTTAVKELLAL